MERVYQKIMQEHLLHDRQMVFLAGPRQVGKTTISKTAATLTQQFVYLNWDFDDDQTLIMQGPQAIVDRYHLQQARKQKAIVTLDEIHKYKHWRNYLKGLYDKFFETTAFIITGSSKMDVFRTAGDSLMGRYFPYRVHPLTVAELLSAEPLAVDIRPPSQLSQDIFSHLLTFGGFPEPLSKQTQTFYHRWVKLRTEQLFQMDIRELTRIHDIAQMKLLSGMLKTQIGGIANYSHLAKLIRVSADTIKAWITTLESFYYCFRVSPWSKNITRSLIKQPKYYLWDWGGITNKGARYENMVASHLLKAIHLWEDRGLGDYGLYFLRDKDGHEVDFLVTKNALPWFLVEVKSAKHSSMSKSLHYFQQRTQAKHAFQVVFDLPYQDINCFEYHQPVVVPALTFLSQLV